MAMNASVDGASAHCSPPLQLRLFPPPKPLLDRFGPDFFRSVPACPGVYLISGEGHRLLYVGQSQNLRDRLNSYKNLNPERSSRKLVRLVHLARSITWEICGSPEQARLRENELLRLHKPALNVANTRPENYAFVGMQREGSRLALRLTKSPVVQPGERLYGAFKGLWSVRAALAALLRCFWALGSPSLSPHDIPSALVHGHPPEYFALDLATMAWPDLEEPLARYYGGTSHEFLALLSGRLSQRHGACPFLLRLWEQDLERLSDFYRFGPERSLALRQHFEITETVINSAELDDLLVLRRQPSPNRQGIDPPEAQNRLA